MDKRILECMDELVRIYKESEEARLAGNQIGIDICNPFTINGIHIFEGIKDMAAASGEEIQTDEWNADYYVQRIVYKGVVFFKLNEKEKA